MNEEIIPLRSRVDSAELNRIKSKFASASRANAEFYESRQLERTNPRVIFTQPGSAEEAQLGENTLLGLSYPLELDGAGGLKLSSNYDRVAEQILEVLETRIGERVYRPFFGLPEILFETIDENTLAQSIKAQLEASLSVVPELSVQVRIDEQGSSDLYIWYSVGGLAPQLIKYTFRV